MNYPILRPVNPLPGKKPTIGGPKFGPKGGIKPTVGGPIIRGFGPHEVFRGPIESDPEPM